jgi:hypothetical protein
VAPVDTVAIIGDVVDELANARLVPSGGGWIGRLGRVEVFARSRRGCLAELRRAAGRDAMLIVEVTPALVGVAEAAAIVGWDKRRVVTYIDRGSFPEPVARLASGRVWRREDVEAFARAWRRKQARRRAR